MEELTLFGLAFVMNRWIYVLAKKYNKPATPYTAISVLIFLFGGAILAYLTISILKSQMGQFTYPVELFYSLLGVSGSIAVMVYYFMLRSKWKPQRKEKANKSLLDDRL